MLESLPILMQLANHNLQIKMKSIKETTVTALEQLGEKDPIAIAINKRDLN